jgi:hypothetical protein
MGNEIGEKGGNGNLNKEGKGIAEEKEEKKIGEKDKNKDC